MTKARDIASAIPAPSTVSSAELGYLDGVTSAIQTQVDAKTAKATLTTKGDIYAASAASTPARLAVGNDGETLVADSSTSTGLRYQAPVQANPVINSNFSVWQRGTSFVGSTGNYPYTADRWQMFANQDERVSRQVTGDTTNLPFIQYCGRVGRVASSTSTTAIALDNTFETVNSIFYAGKTVTLSLYVRKGANYSSTSDVLNVQLIGGTGTDQSLTTGFTGQTNLINSTSTLTTTWQRFTFTVAVGSTFTQLAFRTYYIPTGTAGAADYYEITGIQLEVGSVATPYKPTGATIQGELAACQRYYWRTANTTTYAIHGSGNAYLTTASLINVIHPVPMRTAATSVDYSDLRLDDNVSGFTFTSLTLNSIVKSSTLTNVNITGASGLTQYRFYNLSNNNNTAGYIGFSAEL